MKRILISTKHPEESRIVVTDNGRLADFDHEVAGRENRKGDIYKGVVSRLEPSLEAAFVDFGDDKNGFLPFKDIPRALAADDSARAAGSDAAADPSAPPPLKEGDSVLVQIGRDHVSEKGAALSMNISLAGCYLVLMPLQPGGRQITKQSDRRTREEMMERLRELDPPRGMSVILRTAGLGRSAEELRWDLDYLLKLWSALAAEGEKHRGPVLIHNENDLLLRSVRDHHRPDVAEVVCDNPADYENLRAFMSVVFPDQADRVRLDEGEIIDDALESQIEEVFAREVAAPSGARVVFDTTEALVAIDVNSAKLRRGENIEETALRANLAAAEVIARQLRLRDLGGLVVVDFIDMEDEKNRARVEQHFRGLLRRDRARVRTTDISRFGMMELSRQRLSQSVVDAHDASCPRCNGSGVVRRDESFALTLLRRIRAQAGRNDDDGAAILVQAPEGAAAYLLNQKRGDLRNLEEEFGCEIEVISDSGMHPPDCRIRAVKGARPADFAVGQGADKMTEARERLREKRRQRPRAKLDVVMPDARQPSPTPTHPASSMSGTSSGAGTKASSGAGATGTVSEEGIFAKVKRILFGGGGSSGSPKAADGKSGDRDSRTAKKTGTASMRERYRAGRDRDDESRDGKSRRGRRGRRGRDGREGREGRDGRESREGREGRESRDRDHRESRDGREGRESRGKSDDKPDRRDGRGVGVGGSGSRRPRRDARDSRELPVAGSESSERESESVRDESSAVSAKADVSDVSAKAESGFAPPEPGMSAEFAPLPESDSDASVSSPSRPSRPSRRKMNGASPSRSANGAADVSESSSPSSSASESLSESESSPSESSPSSSESSESSVPPEVVSPPPVSPMSQSDGGLRQVETRD